MTKKNAYNWICKYLRNHQIPKNDAVVHSKIDKNGNITAYTFKCLLKIANDL